MSRALQIYYSAFDEVLLKLPHDVRGKIESALDNMGLRLDSFSHYRMTGSSHYRLRVGDDRIIYTFNVSRNEIHLLAVGHRREIYR